MQQKGVKDLPMLIKSIRIIFSNIQTNVDISREALLYLTLCKEIISKEIESSIKIEDLFINASCPSAQFLITFFSREYGSDLYYKILFKPIQETISMIEAIGVEGFAIDPTNIATKTKRKIAGTSETILKDKKAKNAFDEGVTYVIRALGFYVEAFKAFSGTLPNSVKILLKHAYSKMVNKA